MNILVVGNILKDVYLGLDGEKAEVDKNGTPWIDFSFDAGRHEFFSRTSIFGGAAVTLEVFEKMGIKARASSGYGEERGDAVSGYRYILTYDDRVSYLVPRRKKATEFRAPAETPSLIFVDRSAELSGENLSRLNRYLKENPGVELVVYVRGSTPSELIERADLVFLEEGSEGSGLSGLSGAAEEKVVRVSEGEFRYGEVSVPVSRDRIDRLTHLSAFSIGSATILGCFLLGYSVGESLKLAKINVENARLDSVLGLDEMTELLGEGD